MSVLPIGTPLWVAQAARPDGTRRALAGDGTVVSHVPCDACWQRYAAADLRRMSPAAYAAVAAACDRPAGFVATVHGWPVTVTASDDTVLAVPITSDERSAA
ncbi:hypothetical protein [Streptomyces natalensis]|uniref:Uncharacterized protein n=1 Tax=Streptomyces natalensis ATCC 27448 TaxID=1240678 RepID=A0A0D7CN86_9ACTN|nr:hypothetical protein [Streptomyces natalensis]KIZ16887.1 hypothetical protein SNA_18070 [Streptomyces natalensis ATCC 27448]